MSRKTITILIIVGAILVAVLFGLAWYLQRGGSLGEVGLPVNTRIFEGFFPTDKPEETVGGGGGGGGGSFFGSGGEEGRDIVRLGEGRETPALPALRKIAEGPVAGGTVFSREGETFARYVERRTGHIYEVDLANDNRLRLSNTTIPAVQEVYWSQDGEEVIFRYTDERNGRVLTFTGAIDEEANELNGSFITESLLTVAESGDSNRALMFFDAGAAAVGTAADYDGARRTELFGTPFREWRVLWPETGTVALTTKPSKDVAGYLYFVNTRNGVFTKILNGLPGLTSLTSPDTGTVLYTKSTRRGFETFFLNNGETEQLAVATLPADKCVWADDSENVYCGVPTVVPRGNYPDDWYQGQISLSDDIWRIERETGFTDRLASPDTLNEEIDILDPKIDADGTHLVFLNKKDRSLWTLRLEE